MVAWTAWLLIAAVVCLAADIGGWARVAAWLALAGTFSSYRRFIGLGEHAVVAAGVDSRGLYIILGRASARRVRARAVEFRRFGNLAWVLSFPTASGTCSRLVFPGLQEPRTLRRWLRSAEALAGQGRAGPFRASAGE